ncbi:competence protein A [mine drainage metagenome]|uniref:Competence protein A n=1 Tax=mine drainage metagenome TaxID=410659 RepID=A0A1J5SLN6_9ZZZZ
MQFFNKKKKPGWYAISATEQGACVAHVLKSPDDKPMVTLAKSRNENLKDNTATKTLVNDLNLASHHCSLLLKHGEYQLLQIEKPNVPAEELKQAVRWKLKDMIDYPVEQATIDVINIPTNPDNARRQAYVYAVATRNELISTYIQSLIEFSESGLEVIDIPELAQRNVAAYLEQENRGLAMLSINGADGLLTFTSNGELYYARGIDVNIKHLLNDDSEQKSTIFERLSLEIQRSLDNFERQFPYINVNRLVLAPFVGREDFYDYLKTSLFVQVDRFDLADVFSFETGVELGDLAMQASLLPALGAALREEQSS